MAVDDTPRGSAEAAMVTSKMAGDTAY